MEQESIKDIVVSFNNGEKHVEERGMAELRAASLYRRIIESTLKALKIDLTGDSGLTLDAIDESSSLIIKSLIVEAIESLYHEAQHLDSLSNSNSVTGQDWQEYNEEHPVPSFRIDSPVVANVLSTWTAEDSKVSINDVVTTID
jgi:hypothetical protein